MPTEEVELESNISAGREGSSLRDSPDTDDHAMTVNIEEKNETSVTNDTPEAPVKPEGPPDGGLRAWSQVAGAFILFFNTWYVRSDPLS